MKNEDKKYLNFYNTKFGQEVLEKELEFVESKLKDCKSMLSIDCGPSYLDIGDVQNLGFNDNSFETVVYVTSLEFIASYKKSIRETHRVLKPKRKLLILMLNPKSNYFNDEYSDKNSYIRKNIRNIDIKEIISFISKYFIIENEEYFLGIKDKEIFESNKPKLAGLYVLEGKCQKNIE